MIKMSEVKVLHEREGYRFVEKGILEINGKPDYRLQKRNEFSGKWYDIYNFDNSLQCTMAMEDIEYAKWLDPDGVYCYRHLREKDEDDFEDMESL